MAVTNLLYRSRCDIAAGEVFRMMGYPDSEAVSEPVRECCHEQIRRLEDLLDPWGSTRVVTIESVERDAVHLAGDATLRSRRLASILRHATSLAICLVTVGSRITAEIHRLVARDEMIEALALDAAGSAATSALMSQLRERLCCEVLERGCGTMLPYGPGYTGWHLRDTPTVFSYLADDALPVRLNEQLMMVPEKSLLNVIGIGPSSRRAPEVVPCRLCDLQRCELRRAPYRPGRDR